MRILLLIGVFCTMLFSWSGCVTTDEREGMSKQYKTQTTLFLKGPERASLDITFELLAVNIIAEDGTATEVLNQSRRINSYDMQGRQIMLGEKTLPEGSYKQIELIVKEALITKKREEAHLALPAEGIRINIDVTLKKGLNTTFLINWNADASVQDGYLFSPVFTVKRESPELSSLLIYVTNEDSNNVSVINRQTGEIVATVLAGRKPRGIVTSTRGERLRVYVANSGSNSISVIDPTTNKLEREIPIRFGRQPEGIAVASVSADKELILTANYGSDNVSIIDARTYEELEKVRVGQGPIAIAVDPPLETLIGSRFLDVEDINVLRSYRERFLNAYVANHNSNDVSVLRIDKITNRTVEVITLKVEWRPVAIHVDYQRGKVYVANYDSDKLSVIDILQTVKGNIDGAVSRINNAGHNIIDIISDPSFDRIYLLKEVPGEIVIFRPFAGEFESLQTIMPPVMGTIPVGNSPRAFIMDPENRKLYVVNTGSDNISVVDKTTKREEAVIPVGRKPYGIAVFPR